MDQQKKIQIPPINIITEGDPKTVVKLIKSVNIKHFTMKKQTGKKYCVQLNSMEDYDMLKKTLKLGGLKFFTYTPKHLKNQTFVLKGLHSSEETDDIFKYLQRYSSDDL